MVGTWVSQDILRKRSSSQFQRRLSRFWSTLFLEHRKFWDGDVKSLQDNVYVGSAYIYKCWTSCSVPKLPISQVHELHSIYWSSMVLRHSINLNWCSWEIGGSTSRGQGLYMGASQMGGILQLVLESIDTLSFHLILVPIKIDKQ
jgi:hypothetical protein